MKRIGTIIGVADVPHSCKWYQALFGQVPTPPNHDYFGQILDTDGTVLLCLHEWGSHDHPSLMNAGQATSGRTLSSVRDVSNCIISKAGKNDKRRTLAVSKTVPAQRRLDLRD